MITRKRPILRLPSFLRVHLYSPRALHARSSSPPVPSPTPFVPDAATFLSLIGRGLSQHTGKITNWQSLFSLTSTQLRELGVEPARTRRYLLWWRDRFTRGIFGVGGDLKYVHNGEGKIKVVEFPLPGTKDGKSAVKGVPSDAITSRFKKLVVNEPPGLMEEKPKLDDVRPVEGMKVRGAKTIVGPYIRSVKGTSGSVATIKAQEGMWEIKRGVKVDGGERRKVQVRRKRLLEERKTTRK